VSRPLDGGGELPTIRLAGGAGDDTLPHATGGTVDDEAKRGRCRHGVSPQSSISPRRVATKDRPSIGRVSAGGRGRQGAWPTLFTGSG
jgi:hypothetical protein